MTVPHSALSLREFSALMAAMMSIVAISIDAMLPALGIIGTDLKITHPNHAQYIVSFLFLGMAISEIVCGPLSDALGRKRVLFGGIAIYFVGTVVCLMSESLAEMLTGRFLQGVGVAAPYVTTVSIVRDKYSGREMARVMSLVMMIFVMVPAIAPSLGQGILLFGTWQHIFWMYIFYACAICAWVFVRLPETLPPPARIPFSARNIAAGFREVATNRVTMSCTVCMGLFFGSFIGYLNACQQIFQVQFGVGAMFSLYFGGLAIVLGLASYVNSWLVERYGMYFISLRAIAVIIAASALFLALHYVVDTVTLWMFMSYAVVLLFSFGLLFGNVNALAMEPMGHIAGIAAAVIGCVSSIMSMVLGTAIGQMYDGSLIPVTAGFLFPSILAFAILMWASKAPVAAVSDAANDGDLKSLPAE